MPQTISKSGFKPKALQYFRKIQEDGQELIITDHNKPVLRIIPYREQPEVVLREFRNTVRRYEQPLEPVGENDWEALK